MAFDPSTATLAEAPPSGFDPSTAQIADAAPKQTPAQAAAEDADNETAGLLTGTEPVVTTKGEAVQAAKGALKGVASIVTGPIDLQQGYDRWLYNKAASALGVDSRIAPAPNAGDLVNAGLTKVGFPAPQNRDEEAAELAGSTIGGNLAGLGLGGRVPAGPDVGEAAQAAIDSAYARQAQGAAPVAIDASTLSPEVQAEIAQVGASRPVNTAAIERIKKAESVGLSGPETSLTEGQAMQDTGLMSEEHNMKGQHNNAIGNRYDAQDEALRNKVAELHQEAAPAAVANDEVQNGQAIVDGLKRYDQPKKDAIDAAYKAARDANTGDLAMDAPGIVKAADTALKGKEALLPTEAKAVLDRLRSDEPYTLTQFETDRTILARASRKYDMAGDGNAVNAIGDVRDALENAQPLGGSAQVKALYDKARSLAKGRFDEIKADPAYNAAVEDTTPSGQQSDLADKFAQKYITNGNRANLQRIRAKLAGDADADQAITSSAYNGLRKAAETSRGFSQAGYNAALKKINAKPELINNSEHLQTLNDVGDVAGMVQRRTRGGYQNDSHSYVALAKGIIGAGAEKTWGLSAVRAAQQHLAMVNRVNKALKPGAGI